MKKSILFINPWIYDFAAYDMWMKPLAMLYLASIFKELGAMVTLVDCLEGVQEPNEKRVERIYGCRKYLKERIEKPKTLKFVKRYYSRYGITLEDFKNKLLKIEHPDLIVLSSMMTYWYGGVIDTIKIVKDIFPRAKIVLGGKYAEICTKHAETNSGAEYVLGKGDISEKVNSILKALGEETRCKISLKSDELIYPAWDLYEKLRYVCILTSVGCPFKCTYCYTPVSGQQFIFRNPSKVVEEMEFWNKEYGVKNFAFYDDALNYKPNDRFLPMLDSLKNKRLNLFLHAPNALSARWMDDDIAKKMYDAGFKTVRLGFETSNCFRQKDLGGKIYNDRFKKSAKSLVKAGFDYESLGAYLLVGIPYQEPCDVIDDIDFLLDLGIKPYLAEYSPIPNTPLFEQARKISRLDLEGEPLYQNNSILPLQNENFKWEDLEKIKAYLRTKLKNSRSINESFSD